MDDDQPTESSRGPIFFAGPITKPEPKTSSAPKLPKKGDLVRLRIILPGPRREVVAAQVKAVGKDGALELAVTIFGNSQTRTALPARDNRALGWFLDEPEPEPKGKGK